MCRETLQYSMLRLIVRSRVREKEAQAPAIQPSMQCASTCSPADAVQKGRTLLQGELLSDHDECSGKIGKLGVVATLSACIEISIL